MAKVTALFTPDYNHPNDTDVTVAHNDIMRGKRVEVYNGPDDLGMFDIKASYGKGTWRSYAYTDELSEFSEED